MATIVLTTYGSSGDLNPILALGRGLEARGHHVLVAVEKAHRAAVAASGLVVHDLPGDNEAALLSYRDALFSDLSPVAFTDLLWKQSILPTLPGTVAALREVCAGADLLVATVQQMAAGLVAELDGIPWVSVALSPLLLPSDAVGFHPALGVLPRILRPLIDRAAWGAAMLLGRHLWDPAMNRVRVAHGLRPRRDAMIRGARSPLLTAVAVSSTFFARPADWPPYIRLTGFLFWDTPDAWGTPPALADFLADPRPLIAVSSGSMAPLVGDVFAGFYRTSIAAIRRSGARALVIGASADTLPVAPSSDVLAIPFAPFSRVYAHCAAVIHHGGIGTVAQALRAGTPELVAPWGVDQYANGVQVTRLGAGQWMRRRTYTPARAARILNDLTRQPRYRERTRAIARHIAGEDGIATLCGEIDGLLGRARRPRPPGDHPARFIDV